MRTVRLALSDPLLPEGPVVKLTGTKATLRGRDENTAEVVTFTVDWASYVQMQFALEADGEIVVELP